MRRSIPLAEGWTFSKGGAVQKVTLPHTWNAVDGQDGGDDYYRGVCTYRCKLPPVVMEKEGFAYLEFGGVNASARVFVNGVLCGAHDGGYAAFRVEITQALREENDLLVEVDNAPNDTVYPQRADFTFYGGIYRDVKLITVPSCHFALDQDGSPGIILRVDLREQAAVLTLHAAVDGFADQVRYTVREKRSGAVVLEGEGERAVLTLGRPHLWDGLKDPFLYTLTAETVADGRVTDAVTLPFGCRSMVFDAEKGFFLNGRPYQLRGVSRHQDREGVGNALTRAMHEEDFALIREMGANAVRLAHYQHDAYAYDLCDETGLVVWAEIPFISEYMPKGVKNAEQQLCELIRQNMHHASIACWALSNEITASGYSQGVYDTHVYLNDMAHRLDPTRPTATANAFMLETDSPLLDVPDILGYNLYFGWYLGTPQQNGEFFDRYHAAHPTRPMALTEYGADAFLQWQTARPHRGDYTEQYQAEYHRRILDMLEARPFLWGGFVWNMFDFAADARDEGGTPGRNGKGLITFDRRVKKDAYYLYKAYWSEEPFVHIAGRRYVDRAEENTEIVVYSNLPEVRLHVNGALFAAQEGSRVFRFAVPHSGETTVAAYAGDCADAIHIRKVEEDNPAYVLPGQEIVNWLDREVLPQPAGYFSVYDTIGALCDSEHGLAFIERLMGGGNGTNIRVPFDGSMRRMLKDETIAGILLRKCKEGDPKELLRGMNAALNRIPRQ